MTQCKLAIAARVCAIAGISGALWVAFSLCSVPASAASSGLTVTAAAVGNVADGELIVVQVTNTGDVGVDTLRVATDAPFGVTVKPATFTLASLCAGASALFRFILTGGPAHMPASLVITATGRQGAIALSALDAVALAAVEPEVQATLTGDDTISDTSPATDVVVLQNLVDAPVLVILNASAGPNVVRLAQIDHPESSGSLTLRLQPYGASSVVIDTTAHIPLDRGSVPLVVTAATNGADGVTGEVIATRDLEVSLAADLLPGPLGVSSVVLVPGLVGMWAIVARYQRDRRRIGLENPSAAEQVWDNKILLVAAIFLSVFTAFAYRWLGLGDVWSAPTLSDIVILSAASAVVGALVMDIFLFVRRLGKPAVSPASEPLDVLRAAARAKDSMARPVYRTTEGLRGLLVHMDWGAVVMTPPIQFTEVDDVLDRPLNIATDRIKGTQNPRAHIQFLLKEGYVLGPRAVASAIQLAGQQENILQYTDEPLRGTSPATRKASAAP